MRRLSLVSLLVLLGCDAILSTDDYRTGETAGAAGPVGTVFFSEQCNACLDASCARELDGCDEDSVCRELEACLESCRDPKCWMACMRPGHHQFNGDWPLRDLDSCIIGNCAEACRLDLGNFDCADAYSLNGFYHEGERIVVEAVVGQLAQVLSSPYPGYTVKACRTSTCTPPIDEVVTGDDGRARLEVTARGRGFPGFIRMTSPEEPDRVYETRYDEALNDFFRPSYELAVDPARFADVIYEDATGETLPDDYAVVVFPVISDCHYWEPGGVTLDVTPDDGVTIWYQAGGDATAMFVTAIGFAAPPGDYVMELRDASGKVFRRIERELTAGLLSSRWILPEDTGSSTDPDSL